VLENGNINNESVNEQKNVITTLSQGYHNVIPMLSQGYHNVITDDKNEKSDENNFFQCPYCMKEFTNRHNKSRHIKFYCTEKKNKKVGENSEKVGEKNKNELIERNKELEKENRKLVKEKYELLLNEKDERIKDKDKYINIIKHQNKVVNTQNIGKIDNSRTTNYLNITLPDMIDIDTFMGNLMTSHRLSNDQTRTLLDMFKTCGTTSYGNCLSRTLRENCYQQIRDMNKDSKGIKMLPIVTTDSNLRSHKEKHENTWKKIDNDKKINDIITISNDQVYKNHNEPIYLDNKDMKKVGNIIKKDHGINELEKHYKELEYKTEISDDEISKKYLEYMEDDDKEDESIYESEEEDKKIEENILYDKNKRYSKIIDCGKNYIYDIENLYVFNEKKEYVGVVVHDENCPVKHKDNNISNSCWKYVDYK
tara:strand:+ start:749 stop:2017 length:1269 start_codon:yes stop_codon:yes gene_type:complete